MKGVTSKQADQGIVDYVSRSPFLRELFGLMEAEEECYLVGGVLRDLLMERPVFDIDLVTPKDPTSLARRFAAVVRGHWFFLDKERGHSRVVVGTAGEISGFDFAPFRAADLESDLAARDFTINALAWRLHPGKGGARLIDPLGGREDLAQRILSVCSASSLRNDPLRVLRGVRLATHFSLQIETETLTLMAEAAPGLEQIAGERIVAELGKIFSVSCAARGAKLLHDLGCLDILFGPVNGGGEGFGKGLELLEGIEKFLEANFFAPWLEKEMEAGWGHPAFLRFAALLRDLGVNPDEGMIRLPFSRSGRGLLAELMAVQPGRVEEYRRLTCSERGRALWLDRLGRNPREAMLFSALLSGEDIASCGPELTEAFSFWAKVAVDGRIPSLIGAAELQSRFGVPSGPDIGVLLRELDQAEIDGLIATREEALDWLRKRLERD
ncbi:MAG: CCA tRNA nucleotidyltransferase [Desulfuromonadaceae bacterium]|nr:CCA tRNA nucleotidyltransferase [Desulfuromonadaceae bacterium]